MNDIGGRTDAGNRWRKMRKKDIPAAEVLLRGREKFCVAASGRFLRRKPDSDAVWVLKSKAGNISAVVVYVNKVLLPVFCGQTNVPPPQFLKNIFGMIPVHSVQGLSAETTIVEQFLENCGLEATEKINYDLMYLDKMPVAKKTAVPNGLIIRHSQHTDMNALALLQAGYEKEEVLPKGAIFNPTASRLNMERIFANEQLLVAELGGQVVGKINTSASTFTCFQIGGVYVHPDFRGKGIARRMTAEFVRTLIEQKKNVSLFVKKSNAAALSVYRQLGFQFLADYRISYY